MTKALLAKLDNCIVKHGVWLVKINRGKVSTGIAIVFIIFVFSLACPNIQAQTSIPFNTTYNFSVPLFDGNISFAVNGTYSNATFENNTWTFTNLRLNGSQPLENFEISTQNSNVTILSYIASNNAAFSNIRLSYVTEGKGTQILNLGLGSGSQGEGYEWTVSFNGAVISEDDGWSISHDGTLVITGATGNISVIRFDFGNTAPSNLPFYQQHSIAIITALGVVATVTIAVVIKVRSRKYSSKDELVKSV